MKFEQKLVLHATMSFVMAVLFVAPVLADTPPKVERRKPLTANVGVVSVGLDTYWKQCPGLYDDMLKKAAVFEKHIAAHQVKVTSFGISDNPQKAASLIPAMKAADLDLLFVDMVTYATSSTFAPFVRELTCPIVLIALQPDARLDYEHATIYKQLYNDDLCSVPEFTGVAIRYGRPVADVIIGQLEELESKVGVGEKNDTTLELQLKTRTSQGAAEEIRQWCAVAHVLHDLRRARIGLMGHVLEAMYDLQVDPTAVSRTFGCHVALCEPDEIMPSTRLIPSPIPGPKNSPRTISTWRRRPPSRSRNSSTNVNSTALPTTTRARKVLRPGNWSPTSSSAIRS